MKWRAIAFLVIAPALACSGNGEGSGAADAADAGHETISPSDVGADAGTDLALVPDDGTPAEVVELVG